MQRNPHIAAPSLSFENRGEAVSVTEEVRTARTGTEHASAALDDGWKDRGVNTINA